MIIILLTLLVLLGVGATFFGLANRYGKNPLPYAILGIFVFTGSALLFDVSLMSIFDVYLVSIIFASYPAGLLGCLLLFSRLKKAWSKEKAVPGTGALDDGVTIEEQQ